MRILQISHRYPYPLNEGGTIGIYNYTRGFHEAGHEVTLLTLHAIKHEFNMKLATEDLERFARIYSYNIDTDVKIIPAFLNLFTNKSYNVIRFYDKNFDRFLQSLLQSQTFDIIQVEGTFVAHYIKSIRRYSKAPVVLRQHNVEHQIWERLALNENNVFKKWYLNLLAKRLKNFEQSISNYFDVIVPVTDSDAEIFKQLGCTQPIFVSPAGIDTNYWYSSDNVNLFHIFHIGSLDWRPNREAVLWFIKEVWPKIVQIDYRFKLFIAGKNMPPSMESIIKENLLMMGEVYDAASFVHDKAITVVPLLSGSGIRLKILEAMAASKLVISTTIGAQGIDYENGKNILIADTPEEFVSYFKKLAQNIRLYDDIKQNGLELIKLKYSNQAVIQRILTYYQTVIEKHTINS